MARLCYVPLFTSVSVYVYLVTRVVRASVDDSAKADSPISFKKDEMAWLLA
jgi:hypothetical protein